MEFDELNDIIQKYYSYFKKNTHYLSAFGINQETCNWFGYGPLNFITALKVHEKAQWTPYKNQKITGWPEMTMSRGDIIVQNDEFLGKKGWGLFI
ncbi:hypothetical protein [Methanococcoides alaskense]|uniref:Uncharacterized protein n=1 Tax=Methanococcoides alaskense TaxID=325778 RepID=A0AA90TXF9_9EURY|nr:hypothetical protein [Methanococcoides alaskense]MDA0525302.1 hypothetical protein [Methanococcoides alaskense]MDR6221774.1 hypothetical protein [Methanococcoides alaskense]